MRIVLVAGLPGSGKTTLLKSIEAEGAAVVDDMSDLARLPSGDVDVLAIADVSFCRTSTREAAEAVLASLHPGAAVEWIFFDNDPDACLANARARNDGRNVAPDIAVLSRIYVVPEEATSRPVFGSGSCAGLEEDASLRP